MLLLAHSTLAFAKCGKWSRCRSRVIVAATRCNIVAWSCAGLRGLYSASRLDWVVVMRLLADQSEHYNDSSQYEYCAYY